MTKAEKETVSGLVRKYEKYISNLKWHINTNKPPEKEVTFLINRIKNYKEVVEDLKKLVSQC